VIRIDSRNCWRWRYPSPAEVAQRSAELAHQLRPVLDAHSRRSKVRQEDNRASTGFAGERADLGHAVVWELRKRRYSASVAWFAGQLVSCGGIYNFQGNARIAKWGGFSERTAQRARAVLEADKLLTSYVLEAGQQVEGQRSPVRRPQVVRDIRALLGLLPRRIREQRPMRRDRKSPGGSAPLAPTSRAPASTVLPSAFSAPDVTPATAELFNELARKHPEFSRYFVGMAAAASKKPPQPPVHAPAEIDPKEVDAWESDTERLERLDEPFADEPAERPPPS
jgi:hypothetical protein